MTEESSARRSLIAANAKQIRDLAPWLATNLMTYSVLGASKAALDATKQIGEFAALLDETVNLLAEEMQGAETRSND